MSLFELKLDVQCKFGNFILDRQGKSIYLTKILINFKATLQLLIKDVWHFAALFRCYYLRVTNRKCPSIHPKHSVSQIFIGQKFELFFQTIFLQRYLLLI